MVVPEPGHFLAPGAQITSRIGNTPVFIDVAEIATALDYQRPTRPVNFPRPDETFDQNEIAGYLYEHRKNARIPHWPGRFTTAYRFINQVVCFNLYPRGRESAPQRSVGNLMYAFMGEDTVSDWALCIFGQMCDFRDAPTTLRMPFPCLVTKILRTRNVPGKRFYSNEDLLPGDLDSSFIQRSMTQWSLIAGRLPGRTSNDVKNYWNTHLHKKPNDQREDVQKSKMTQRTMEKTNLIRPRPRTFSKNLPWQMGKTIIIDKARTKENFSNPFQTSSPGDDDGILWWDNMLSDPDINR
ncbi:hypothetical protein RHGRI_023241 [Rhododendron griersonianum]|uniref:Uncharacterized protein n=1 Tax=Rhododendron griersonianum TaxID=479676 RepID=A0AAV6J7A2_9ERIC|nr:hypothetical protein RHGRI_023241 [Rhododendron griersonianum]